MIDSAYSRNDSPTGLPALSHRRPGRRWPAEHRQPDHRHRRRRRPDIHTAGRENQHPSGAVDRIPAGPSQHHNASTIRNSGSPLMTATATESGQSFRVEADYHHHRVASNRDTEPDCWEGLCHTRLYHEQHAHTRKERAANRRNTALLRDIAPGAEDRGMTRTLITRRPHRRRRYPSQGAHPERRRLQPPSPSWSAGICGPMIRRTRRHSGAPDAVGPHPPSVTPPPTHTPRPCRCPGGPSFRRAVAHPDQPSPPLLRRRRTIPPHHPTRPCVPCLCGVSSSSPTTPSHHHRRRRCLAHRTGRRHPDRPQLGQPWLILAALAPAPPPGPRDAQPRHRLATDPPRLTPPTRRGSPPAEPGSQSRPSARRPRRSTAESRPSAAAAPPSSPPGRHRPGRRTCRG